MKAEEQLARLTIPDEKYNMPVEQLDLSVRTMNCLRRAGITTIGELISKGEKELLSLRNFGQKSRQELEARLNTLDLSLNPQPTKEETEQLEPEIEPAIETTETESTAEEEPETEENQPQD